MDPQQRLMLELSWEALEDARTVPADLRGTRTGVFAGAIWDDYATLTYRHGAEAITPHTMTGVHRGILANRVSYALGLRGPSVAVDTGQSSSLVSVHLACESLRRGESELAVAGGVNLALAPERTTGSAAFGALSPDGRCFTFDERANGYIRGEGGGVVVLKPLSRAVADGDRVHCVILGGAVFFVGVSVGLFVPGRRRPGPGSVRRAARHRDPGRRPGRGRRAGRGAGRRTPSVRAAAGRLRQDQRGTPGGRGRHRRAAQDRARPHPRADPAEPQLHDAEPADPAGGAAPACRHGAGALARRRRPRRGVLVRHGRDQLPSRADRPAGAGAGGGDQVRTTGAVGRLGPYRLRPASPGPAAGGVRLGRSGSRPGRRGLLPGHDAYRVRPPGGRGRRGPRRPARARGRRTRRRRGPCLTGRGRGRQPDLRPGFPAPRHGPRAARRVAGVRARLRRGRRRAGPAPGPAAARGDVGGLGGPAGPDLLHAARAVRGRGRAVPARRVLGRAPRLPGRALGGRIRGRARRRGAVTGGRRGTRHRARAADAGTTGRRGDDLAAGGRG